MNIYRIVRCGICTFYSKRLFHSRNVHIDIFEKRWTRKGVQKYIFGTGLLSWTWFTKSSPEPLLEADAVNQERQQVIEEADSLFKQNRYRDLCELLSQYKDGTDVELLWRLTRAQYNLAQELSTSSEEKKSLTYEAFGIIARSLALDETHFANHKWMSIMLDARSTYDGIKKRISHLETVKQHMLKATELNPKDATTLYMLGLWCYQITDMPWYQRKIASTIFTAPPHSSFEEALMYFTQAEEAEPRFYCKNLLMLGKTYLKLKREDRAKYYLDLACNYPAITDEDHMANKEACELLSELLSKKKK